MKTRPAEYAELQRTPGSEPRYVIGIEFGPADFEYFSSHTGITDIPAGTYENTLADWSAVSQSVDPSTGASRIGSLNVRVTDVAEVMTDEIQARLAAGDGLRDKQLILYKGFSTQSFDDFEIKFTQQIANVSEFRAEYAITCKDLQRSLRSVIFELQKTHLDATLLAGATSMTVGSTADFETVAHGTSYSHGPSATWGYLQLDDEIVGYTGKTATTFTGLARGLFNTDDDDHNVEGGDPPERKPQIVEYVYLEMPVPKLYKALTTGVLHGQGSNLPAGWHLGIDAALIDDAQITGIGVDLWDPANDAVGLIARFTDIQAIDGKRFIESELFLLAQIFAPVLSDGRLGLKRLTPALAGAAYVETLDTSNVIKHGALDHQMTKTVNRTVINWSWISGEFKRSTINIDASSIALHGSAPVKTYNFKGLAANIATDSVLTQRFDAIRDRFSSPPMQISVQAFKYLDALEVGDIVRLLLPHVRDMTAATDNPIDRSFEIRSISESRKGPVKLTLVGSSATPVIVAPAPDDALPDAHYDQAGTELSTVVDITTGVTDAGTFSITGNASLAAAIYYYLGDLTLAASTTINIDKNVLLRVRGHLTINGTIDGAGDGHAGIADAVGVGDGPGGTVGYFGNTRGGNGVRESAGSADSFTSRRPDTPATFGVVSSLPVFNLVVDGNALEGVPDDLQGTSGGPGGKLVDGSALEAVGGAGGAGGAGLMIVCRGISFGSGGLIDLDGVDGSAGNAGNMIGLDCFSGGGAGGAPGALFIALDGDVTAPVLTAKFSAVSGDVIVTGNPMTRFHIRRPGSGGEPYTGLERPGLVGADHFDAAHRVQYVPADETPVEDLPDTPAAGALTGIGEPEITLHWTQAVDGGAWDPTNTTSDLDIKFRQGGNDVARDARRVTRAADGTLTVSDTTHKDGSDLNTGRLTITSTFGSANRVVTIKADYLFGDTEGSVSETFSTVQGGDDGGTGPDGDDAVTGIAEPSVTLNWTRAVDGGAWDPTNLTSDLDIKFRQGGSDVARWARRVTRAADGTLTVSTVVHKDGSNLNTGRLTVTPTFGSANRTVTIKIDYLAGSDQASISETFSTVEGGDDGPTGPDGDDGVDGIGEVSVTANWTQAPTGGAWDPTNTSSDFDFKFRQGGSDVARDARRVTRAGDGTLTVSNQTHKDGSDLNTGRLTTSTVFGSANRVVTITADYSFGGAEGSISQTFSTVQGGDDGDIGPDGADGIWHTISNEAHVIPALFDGSGYDTAFPNAGGTHVIFDGIVDKTTVAVHSVISPATKNGLTMSVVAGTGVYSLSGASWSTDLETFILRAVYNAVNYDKIYTIAKAKQGSDGGCALDTLTAANLIDSGSGGTREVGFRCDSDGEIYVYDGPASGFGSAKETWKGVCANSSYECRLNKTSGTTPTGSAINTWLLCSSDRSWEWSTTSFESFDGTFQIRRVSDDTVLATVDLDVFIDAGV